MNEIKIKGIYKHFKGNYYIVEDVAKNAEDLEEYVVYRGLYKDFVIPPTITTLSKSEKSNSASFNAFLAISIVFFAYFSMHFAFLWFQSAWTTEN